MENIIKPTKEEIIDEVKRTGILREHHLSTAIVNLIYFYTDYDQLAVEHFLTQAHLIAFLKLKLETSEKYPKDDLEIINLVYESPVKTLTVNNGYVELFANHSMLYYREQESPNVPNLASACFPEKYVAMNIEFVTAAHDNQYLDPTKALTEADQNEIHIASLSHFRFHYESDLRTVYSIKGNSDKWNFFRTLMLKRPKLTSQKIFRAIIGKLNITDFSEYGAEIVEHTAAQNQYTDLDKFLQIQSTLHLLERKFLRFLKELKLAEKIEPP